MKWSRRGQAFSLEQNFSVLTPETCRRQGRGRRPASWKIYLKSGHHTSGRPARRQRRPHRSRRATPTTSRLSPSRWGAQQYDEERLPGNSWPPVAASAYASLHRDLRPPTPPSGRRDALTASSRQGHGSDHRHHQVRRTPMGGVRGSRAATTTTTRASSLRRFLSWRVGVEDNSAAAACGAIGDSSGSPARST
jgi:hypothetical protein